MLEVVVCWSSGVVGFGDPLSFPVLHEARATAAKAAAASRRRMGGTLQPGAGRALPGEATASRRRKERDGRDKEAVKAIAGRAFGS
jgi:hypothetical protein